MQLNETEQMAYDFNNIIMEKLGNRVDDFVIDDVSNDPNYRTFVVEFDAYNYFRVLIRYERGFFGCCLKYGEHVYIDLTNSQKWYDNIDMDKFLEELQQELELRIPDKYLEAHGWK